MRTTIISQNIKEIPAELKPLYKTVWELSQRTLIDMCADRGAYIDQSQSFNVHIPDPNFGKLTSMHFYAWKKVNDVTTVVCYIFCSLSAKNPQIIGQKIFALKISYFSESDSHLCLLLQGLKTGMYYLRTRSAAPPIQFTVDQRVVQQVREEREQLQNKATAAGVGQGEMVSGEEEKEEEGAVPVIQGKVDTESQAYKDAVQACSRENREACAMCSA